MVFTDKGTARKGYAFLRFGQICLPLGMDDNKRKFTLKSGDIDSMKVLFSPSPNMAKCLIDTMTIRSDECADKIVEMRVSEPAK